MKMSDVFEMPINAQSLEIYGVNELQGVQYKDMEIAAANAINMHDELVEMLEICEEFCGDVQQENTALYGYAKRLELKIDELLKKARGEA